MKRAHILLAGVLAAVAGSSAVAGAQAHTANAQAAGATTVKLRNTSLGKILVDSSGFTLYEFTKDSRNTNTCVSVKGCAKVWPALTTTGSPKAGPGVKASLLSTIKLSGGVKQVTYAGHALYTYAESTEAGETSYVGVKHFGGAWDALSASGAAIK
jgi:predicted lipoprotein with Yx(FWY)xxD motif